MNVYYGIPCGITENTAEREIAQRLVKSLATLACHTCNFTTDARAPFAIPGKAPSIIHAFHAAKSGLPCLRLAESNRLPLVITCTGPDAYIDMYNSALKTQLQEVLEAASRVIVPFEQMSRFIRSRLQINTTIEIIPPGVVPFDQGISIQAEQFGFSSADRIIILDGGLLPAKNTIFAINQIERIVNDHPTLRLVIIGDPFDTDYREKVYQESAGKSWVTILGRPETSLLPHLYRHAEVFINVSHAEGYNAHTLLAMQTGIPVIASDIAGNHAFIKDADLFRETSTGWLYFTSPGPSGFERLHDGEVFLEKLLFVLNNPMAAKATAARAKKQIKCSHNADKEAYMHFQLYKKILES